MENSPSTSKQKNIRKGSSPNGFSRYRKASNNSTGLTSMLSTGDSALTDRLLLSNLASPTPLQQKRLVPKHLKESDILLASQLKARESDNFDPFDTKSAYRSERSRTSKAFGKLRDHSIRTGSMGLISAILGTGILALPNGIAHYGWATSLVALCVSAICQIYCYYLLSHAQSLVKFDLIFRRLRQKLILKWLKKF